MAAALLALPCSASGTDADGPFELKVAPSRFDERCLRLEAGAAIRWRFTATGSVDFNVHLHRGDHVLYPVRRERVERASGVFRARYTDDYCLMWTGRAAGAVVVRGDVGRTR